MRPKHPFHSLPRSWSPSQGPFTEDKPSSWGHSASPPHHPVGWPQSPQLGNYSKSSQAQLPPWWRGWSPDQCFSGQLGSVYSVSHRAPRQEKAERISALTFSAQIHPRHSTWVSFTSSKGSLRPWALKTSPSILDQDPQSMTRHGPEPGSETDTNTHAALVFE